MQLNSIHSRANAMQGKARQGKASSQSQNAGIPLLLRFLFFTLFFRLFLLLQYYHPLPALIELHLQCD
jgi:hypothetical protein